MTEADAEYAAIEEQLRQAVSEWNNIRDSLEVPAFMNDRLIAAAKCPAAFTSEMRDCLSDVFADSLCFSGSFCRYARQRALQQRINSVEVRFGSRRAKPQRRIQLRKV